MNEKTDAQVRAWEEQVRLGGLQAFTYFRSLVLSERPWSADDRQGMVDLLNVSEQHMIVMWETLDEVREHERMTRSAMQKVRGV